MNDRLIKVEYKKFFDKQNQLPTRKNLIKIRIFRRSINCSGKIDGKVPNCIKILEEFNHINNHLIGLKNIEWTVCIKGGLMQREKIIN